MARLSQIPLLFLLGIFLISSVSAHLEITNVSGNELIQTGSIQTYVIKIHNSGSLQKQSLVTAYNYKLKIVESVQVFDIQPGETRDVSLKIVTPEYVGQENLIFFATYDYDESSKEYRDITSNHNADQFFRIEVRENEDDITNVIEPEEAGYFSYWIIFLALLLVAFIIYLFYKKSKTK